VAQRLERIAGFRQIALRRADDQHSGQRKSMITRLQHRRQREVAAGGGAGHHDLLRLITLEQLAVDGDHVIHRGRVRMIWWHAIVHPIRDD
jgi:hypothetical protein